MSMPVLIRCVPALIAGAFLALLAGCGGQMSFGLPYGGDMAYGGYEGGDDNFGMMPGFGWGGGWGGFGGFEHGWGDDD
jgi:hypothetical protein